MYDLDQFKDTFIAESFDLIEEMEHLLMEFDEGSESLEEINAIFRCAHSIKGGAGAFGFTRLIGFTHVAEYLLDDLREGRCAIDENVIDSLLQSVDVIRNLVVAAQNGKDLGDDYGMDLQKKLESISGAEVSSDQNAAKLVASQVSGTAEDHGDNPSGELEFFEITFKPFKELFQFGNEPLLIIRELKRVGDVTVNVNTDGVPHFDEMDCEDCYLAWELSVETTKGLDTVKEVFEFVEGECLLDIQEFGAIMLPSTETDLADEDEFGGVFAGALESISDNGSDSGISDNENDKEKETAVESVVSSSAEKSSTEGAKTAQITSMRVDIDRIDMLVNMVGELVITQSMIVNHTSELPSEKYQELIKGVEELTRHTRELQESVMSVRMQPVKSVFARMPRIVRDIAKKLGKNITIEMTGETTEIDKTVIEQLGDPLTHMIRNSVDHGIEKPEERVKAGKSEHGTIHLSADNSGGRIIIEIIDDGAGISRDRVLKKAIEKNLVSEKANLEDSEIDQLIFLPGFSTADEITDVSGRGVGMDVVRRNIEDLGGTISLENNPGKGSRFTVSLPLTLAILDGMIVRVCAEDYIIPINNIIESICCDVKEIRTIKVGSYVIEVRGEFIPVIGLDNVFGTEEDESENESSSRLIILVESGSNKFGLIVDEIIGQQQVVIKNMEHYGSPVQGVAGATILGDGNVALILDVGQIYMMSGVNIINENKFKEEIAA